MGSARERGRGLGTTRRVAPLILDINASRASLRGCTQLRVRRGSYLLQSKAFGVLRTLPGSERSVSPMMMNEASPRHCSTASPTLLRMETPTFALNLASSFGRRQHVRAQLNGRRYWTRRAGSPAPTGPCSHLGDEHPRAGSVLSQGEVGIWLSHLTAWHDIVEGAALRLVLEDDVVLSADIKAVLRNVLIALDGEDWDVVALDVGIEGHTHVGVETTRPFISERCVDAARQLYEKGEVVARLHGAAHVYRRRLDLLGRCSN